MKMLKILLGVAVALEPGGCFQSNKQIDLECDQVPCFGLWINSSSEMHDLDGGSKAAEHEGKGV